MNFVDMLDFKMIAMNSNMVEATLEVKEKHLQPFGLMHGGVSLSLAETLASIASNNLIFSECYPELLEFVKNEDLMQLSEKFRFYMYLNNEGQNRNGNIHYTNLYGTIC